ncbi:MAG: V-type ATP synthase subunit I [Gammaproteobacteria bacterium]|nr:V-type ATP synthase subunit I [Gammaproteobacteria bacterium]
MRAGSDIRHLRLHLLADDLPRAGMALARLQAFAPDQRELADNPLDQYPGEAFADCIRESLSYFQRIQTLLQPWLAALPCAAPPGPEALDRERLQSQHRWLQQAWAEVGQFETRQHQLNEQAREQHQLRQTLAELEGLQLDLGELHNPHRFLQLQIGTLPTENLNNLRRALVLSGQMIIRVSREPEQSRVLIGGPQQHSQQDLQPVLTAAGFRPLNIPSDFRAAPEQLQQELSRRSAELEQQQAQLDQAMQTWVSRQGARLLQIGAVLDAALPLLAIGRAAQSRGDLALLQGWLAIEHLPAAERLLKAHLRHPFLLEQRLPRPEEYAEAPVPPASHPWLRPFSLLVQQFGVPRYGEIDPTWLFSLSFCLMFGMMFGDVGQGALFVLFGLLFRARLGQFAPPLVIAGTASVLFGFVYGSVFGMEHWIEPLWLSPLSDPGLMLIYALAWGIGFITLASVIAIINRLLEEDLSAALFEPGGVFSLVLYLSLVSGLVCLVQGLGFNPASQVILLLALAGLMIHLWRSSSAPLGERALTVLIETFELIIGYFSNSLSFLRVAAFSLNHVALSLAIFTLADMMSGPAHWLMLIFGNLFVMILEGAIVAIQILRLEYYEGFSRFFRADGKAFIPLSYRPAGAHPPYPSFPSIPSSPVR